jgi:hypothetical protein
MTSAPESLSDSTSPAVDHENRAQHAKLPTVRLNHPRVIIAMHR